MRCSVKTVLCSLVLLVGVLSSNYEPVEGIPFNAIVPNLSTGWFHKPGPTESIMFGLLVLKVLALRMTGVFPYNLNEVLAEGGFLDNTLNQFRKSRTQRDLFFMNGGGKKTPHFPKAPLMQEMDVVQRILLGLRRIDSHDCFIRHVCQINQNQVAGRSSSYEDAILKIFSLKPKKEAVMGEKSIWDIYHDALTPDVIDCNQKYQLCPLTKQDMSMNSLLNGIF